MRAVDGASGGLFHFDKPAFGAPVFSCNQWCHSCLRFHQEPSKLCVFLGLLFQGRLASYDESTVLAGALGPFSAGQRSSRNGNVVGHFARNRSRGRLQEIVGVVLCAAHRDQHECWTSKRREESTKQTEIVISFRMSWTDQKTKNGVKCGLSSTQTRSLFCFLKIVRGRRCASGGRLPSFCR